MPSASEGGGEDIGMSDEGLVGVSSGLGVLVTARGLPLVVLGDSGWGFRAAKPPKFMLVGKNSRFWSLGGSDEM